MRIAFLHTADVHVRTFDDIFQNLAPDAVLTHRVDANLLERARADGPASVREDVHDALAGLADADAVLCTCSTLGPLVDEFEGAGAPIVRIDRPLMEQACRDGEVILVALCLESTRQATLELLEDTASALGKSIKPAVVLCEAAWAHFEGGDMDAYAQSIAESVRAEAARHPRVDSIVLAQASMRVAEAALSDIGAPIRSSPVLAAKRCIMEARNSA